MKPLEREIQLQILQYLQARGILAWRANSGAMQGEHKGKKRFVRFNSMQGVSDIIGCFKGLLLCIEVKRPGEKPTPAQRAFLELVRLAGGISFVATSVEDVQRELEVHA
jgi:hypothetical protein